MVYPIGVVGLVGTHVEFALLDAVGFQLGICVGLQFVECEAAGDVHSLDGAVEVVVVQVDGLRPIFRSVLFFQRSLLGIVEIDKDGVDGGLEDDAR